MPLSPALYAVLEAADSHWNRHHGDLLHLKEEVWSYVTEIESRGESGSKEWAKARALLCVLEPAGDEEYSSLTAEWFADMESLALSGSGPA